METDTVIVPRSPPATAAKARARTLSVLMALDHVRHPQHNSSNVMLLGDNCGGGGADGCMVSRAGGLANGQDLEYWVRGCCNDDECHNVHETWGYSGRVDQTW